MSEQAKPNVPACDRFHISHPELIAFIKHYGKIEQRTGERLVLQAAQKYLAQRERQRRQGANRRAKVAELESEVEALRAAVAAKSA